MTLALGIETTGSQLGLALFDGKRSVALVKNVGPRQSEILLPTLQKLLAQMGRRKQDISLVGVDIGPGSFTGVRVGVSVARVLAQVLRIPLIGVSSLEIMAMTLDKKEVASPTIACIPALAGEIYFAMYSPNGQEWKRPQWADMKQFEKFLSLVEKSKKKTRVVVQSWREDLLSLKNRHAYLYWRSQPVVLNPRVLLVQALQKFKKKNRSFSFEKTGPLYLQPSWAERAKRA